MLGGNVYKKRIAIGGKGKSGGTRTILVFKSGSKAFFMTGFAKSEKANIKEGELKALKLMSKLLFAKSHEQLSMDIQAGILIEVER